MGSKNIDRSMLKSIVREVLQEDVSLFKNIIQEILAEHQIIASDEQQKKRERLEKLLDDNFDQYDEVFKALA